MTLPDVKQQLGVAPGDVPVERQQARSGGLAEAVADLCSRARPYPRATGAVGGGTVGDGYVFAKFDLVQREMANLVDSDGLIEILNVRDEVVELLGLPQGRLPWIRDRDDSRREIVDMETARNRLWTFLTGLDLAAAAPWML